MAPVAQRHPDLLILPINGEFGNMNERDAAMLAAQAQQLANNDVQNAQRAYMNRYGGGVGGSSNMGAVIGGIILGNILSGGMGGGGFGGGGWSSTTYGGSQGSSGGGGMLGGGGRF